MAPIKAMADNNNSMASVDGGIVKRRNRIPVSCESCRTRKLKCDRQKPICQNCKARDFPVCHYASQDPARSGAGTAAHWPGSGGSGLDDMGDRLHRLEALVSSMVKHLPSPPPTGAAPPDPDASAPGQPRENGSEAYPSVENAMESSAPYGTMVSAPNGNHFIGSSHWQTILTDIAAIKEHLEDSRAVRRLQHADADQPAIFGSVLRTVSRAELLAALPQRPLADRLVARFFDVYDPSVPYSHFIHQSTFLNHYAAFWADPERVWPTAKLGILFAMLTLSLQSYARRGDVPPDIEAQAQPMADAFRHRAAQCILAANVGAPTFDSVLALKLYGISEYARLPYSDTHHKMVHGLMVTQALRLGLHRDPDRFPSISPFEGEQRRRSWHSICQLDNLIALQMGLPSIIRYEESDVAPPRSLYEDELYESMPALPPSRPPSEPTPVAYIIAKHHIFQVIGRVVRHLNRISVPADEDVLTLTRELGAVLADFPPHLRHRAWAESMDVAVPLRLQRMQLQIFHDKAVCLLNRRFLAVPLRARTRFEGSRGLCVRAALNLLTIQEDMHRMGVKWYSYTLNRNDFLLAVAILCRTLNTACRADNTRPDAAEETQIRDALAQARAIWEQIADVSADARPACRIIELMLERVSSASYRTASVSLRPGDPIAMVAPAAPSASPVPSLVKSEGLGSSNVGASVAPPSGSTQGLSTPEDLQLSDMMDWSTWDSLIQGSSFDANAFGNLDQLWAA